MKGEWIIYSHEISYLPRVNDFIEDCIEDYEKEESRSICFRCNQIFSPEELGEEDGNFFCILCNNKIVFENCGSVFKFEDLLTFYSLNSLFYLFH